MNYVRRNYCSTYKISQSPFCSLQAAIFEKRISQSSKFEKETRKYGRFISACALTFKKYRPDYKILGTTARKAAFTRDQNQIIATMVEMAEELDTPRRVLDYISFEVCRSVDRLNESTISDADRKFLNEVNDKIIKHLEAARLINRLEKLTNKVMSRGLEG